MIIFKRNITLRKSPLFIKWFISYTLVMLFPVIVMGILYGYNVKAFKDNVYQTNNIVLKQLQVTIDDKIEEIRKIAYQISVDPEIDSVINMQLDNEFNYEVIDVSRRLMQYRVTNEFIQDIYICVRERNKVITSSTCNSYEHFFSIFHKNEHTTYEEWIKIIEPSLYNSFFQIYYNSVTGDNLPVKAMAYVHGIPYSNNSDASVVILVNEDSIREYMGISEYKDMDVYILDKDDNLVLSVSGNSIPDYIKAQSIDKNSSGEENTSFIQHNGEKFVLCYSKSDVSDWKYVSVIKYSQYWQNTQKLRNLMIAGILFCILAGLMLSYMLTKSSYQPVSETVKMIPENKKQEEKRSKMEYLEIQNYIKDSLAQKNEISKKLDYSKELIYNNVAVQLLKGELKDLNLAEEALMHFNLGAGSQNYIILLFHIKSDSAFIEDSYLNKIKQTINAFINTVMKDTYRYKVFIIKQAIACLISVTDDNFHSENLKRKLGIIATKTVKLLSNNNGFDMYVTVSNIHKGTGQISKAYSEANDAMDYCIMYGIGKINYYEDIKKHQLSYCNYPLGLEYKLINCIKEGNFKKAKILLCKVLDNNVNNNVDIEILKLLIFNIIGTIIKALDRETISNMFKKIQPLKSINMCHTYLEIKSEMISILKYVCSMVKNDDNTDSNIWCIKIKEFVNENYHMPELNVEVLGMHFNMTPSYLSKIFRKSTGIRLLDYINTVRINKAKQLLEETQESIKHISEIIGYLESSTFIRVFKRYEGITPGEYREGLILNVYNK